jgi:L-fucose isomerase-like protein
MKATTLGVIVGNRGFFPSHLCQTGRETILKVLHEEGIQAVALSPEETEYGSIESLSDAQRCADLFRQHRDKIDGVLVTLPNFGDERAIANTLRWAALDVPVLVHAFPDDMAKMDLHWRRDSFCGKMSACNNLHQYGIKYSLTALHTVDPESAAFRTDLWDFVSTCRIVRGLRGLRIGFLGARPPDFNTVRFSEKLLERAGISVETLDLSDVYGRVERLSADDPRVQAKLALIQEYVNAAKTPAHSLDRMARFGVVVDDWMADNRLQASAIQCWTSMEEYFGVVPCTLMSIMSDNLMPSACETDVAGALAMQVLALASGKPSAIVDWNNNYGDDPDRGVIFHCSNLPKDVFKAASPIPEDVPAMKDHDILSNTVPRAQTWGTIHGRVRAEPFTYLRLSTDDYHGQIMGYLGEGELTDDPLLTFGGYGVVRVPNYQQLLAYICANGYEHHVSINLSRTSRAVNEALGKYLGWQMLMHA